MPMPWVYHGTDGALMIYDRVVSNARSPIPSGNGPPRGGRRQFTLGGHLPIGLANERRIIYFIEDAQRIVME
jgi:hypothetical protein